MSKDFSPVTYELAKELIKIKDEKEFVEGVLTFAFEEEDRLELLNFIKEYPEEATITEVSLRAVDMHKRRKKNMNINEMVVDTFKDVEIGTMLTTAEIIDRVVSKYEINRASFQPSDMCYNRSNKGVEKGKNVNKKIFIWVKRGLYKYVGEQYENYV